MQTFGGDDDVAMSLAGLIEGQAVLRKRIISRDLVFELAVNFKAADDILIDTLPHAAANDKDMVAQLHQSAQVRSAGSHSGPGSGAQNRVRQRTSHARIRAWRNENVAGHGISLFNG